MCSFQKNWKVSLLTRKAGSMNFELEPGLKIENPSAFSLGYGTDCSFPMQMYEIDIFRRLPSNGFLIFIAQQKKDTDFSGFVFPFCGVCLRFTPTRDVSIGACWIFIPFPAQLSTHNLYTGGKSFIQQYFFQIKYAKCTISNCEILASKNVCC